MYQRCLTPAAASPITVRRLRVLTELPQECGIEKDSIASCAKHVLLSQFADVQADGFPRRAHRLRQLRMRDPQRNAIPRFARSGRLTETQKRIDQPNPAILIDLIAGLDKCVMQSASQLFDDSHAEFSVIRQLT